MSDFDSKAFISNLTLRPGVYRMYDGEQTLIYVGKAKSLRKRVSSYFGGRARDAKTMALVNAIASMDVTVTRTETEALILEHTLIKAHKPRFNVLLRDDKSYPWIYFNNKHEFPRLAFYRGRRAKHGKFFGPYPSSGAVRETLAELQKLFLIRPCRDSFFANRSRPCLQYQINRCSGPCVGLISSEEYAADMRNAVDFLEGRNAEVIDNLALRMEQCAGEQDYENAARLRDQITRLRRIEAEQIVAGHGDSELDIVAEARRGAIVVLAVVSIRGGKVTGSQSFFPRVPAETDRKDVVTAFLGQYYLERLVPPEIVIEDELDDHALLESALSERRGSKVSIRHRVRGDRASWRGMATDNAREAAAIRVAEKQSLSDQYEELRSVIDLDQEIKRMECFDISHTGGESTVASCVVFGPEGPLKSDYRRFNLTPTVGGDDYEAMEIALKRRYERVRKGEVPMPDLVLIDGGKGQLGVAINVMQSLGLTDIPLLGVAKGRARRAGSEQLLRPGHKPFTLSPASGALRLIQNIRDEAHRFAITGHRARRARKARRSPLEDIAGLGPKRRAALLRQFGGLQGVVTAGVDDLKRTQGISRAMAIKIYNRLHNESDNAGADLEP